MHVLMTSLGVIHWVLRGLIHSEDKLDSSGQSIFPGNSTHLSLNSSLPSLTIPFLLPFPSLPFLPGDKVNSTIGHHFVLTQKCGTNLFIPAPKPLPQNSTNPLKKPWKTELWVSSVQTSSQTPRKWRSLGQEAVIAWVLGAHAGGLGLFNTSILIKL